MTAGLWGSSLLLQPIKLSNPILASNPRFPQSPFPRWRAGPNPPKTGKSSSTSTENGTHGGGGRSRHRHKSPRKGSYGTSRRSVIKKSLAQEQVVFTAPPAGDPTVAIIGGGVSGLACASALEERGIRSTVFDTGMHGLGGRMATRMVDTESLVFDHAAQFFTVSDPRFQKLVNQWLEKMLVREWKGLVGELEVGGHFIPITSSIPRYIGAKGMRFLADSFLCQSRMVTVVRPCWVSKLEPFNGMWHLSEKEETHGQFDAVVIAHNGYFSGAPHGKSEISPVGNIYSIIALGNPAQDVRKMCKSLALDIRFTAVNQTDEGMKESLELSAVWALLAAFRDPLPTPHNFEAAFVRGVDSISWMANNTSKLFPTQSELPHCWTFFSTAAYGKRNKVPQENIPNVTAERVKTEMLEGVETALGLSKGSLSQPFYTRVQLWGAALPTNTPGVPCIFDPHGRAGICWDWLLGSNVEAAALSGMSLANQIADYFQSGGSEPDDFAIGLHEAFEAVEGHDIGQFHGLQSEKLESEKCTICV